MRCAPCCAEWWLTKSGASTNSASGRRSAGARLLGDVGEERVAVAGVAGAEHAAGGVEPLAAGERVARPGRSASQPAAGNARHAAVQQRLRRARAAARRRRLDVEQHDVDAVEEVPRSMWTTCIVTRASPSARGTTRIGGDVVGGGKDPHRRATALAIGVGIAARPPLAVEEAAGRTAGTPRRTRCSGARGSGSRRRCTRRAARATASSPPPAARARARAAAP